MPLQPNATFTFTGFEVVDEGIRFIFVCLNPGPGQANDYAFLATDAELAAVTTQAQLQTLVTNKLNRMIRATGIASKLTPFIGQSITV